MMLMLMPILIMLLVLIVTCEVYRVSFGKISQAHCLHNDFLLLEELVPEAECIYLVIT